MKKGETIRIPIEGLTPGGKGYAVVEGRTVTVTGALPGDEVDALVVSIRRHTARATLESFATEGFARIEPSCPHFFRCGGCTWQDVPYEVQCRMKALLVGNALKTVHGLDYGEDITVVPSPDEFFFRNKMEFSFDCPPSSEMLRLGLHEPGRYDRVFDVTGCRLQSELSNRVVNFTREFVTDRGLSAYSLKSHGGLLRFLAVRDGKMTGEFMVNLVTSGEPFGCGLEYCDALARGIPGITTVVRTINRGVAGVAKGEDREILSGSGLIRERIGSFTFSISPDAFFQTNPRQTERLYDTIGDFSGLSGTERLLDLYCGTGTIGIYLAGRTGSVTGVESVEDAVADARRNAELNGVDTIRFVAGKAERVIGGLASSEEGYDVIVCDPPRAGIHPRVMDHLVRMRIPRMVYVSCNVGALPGDLETLLLAGYRVLNVMAFDMSPHSPHVETVIALEIPSRAG